MRIQVLNPADSYRPVPHEAVRDFINAEAVKDEIILKVTSTEGSNLKIVHDDTSPIYLGNKVRLASMQVSAYSDYGSDYGLTYFAVTENKRAA